MPVLTSSTLNLYSAALLQCVQGGGMKWKCGVLLPATGRTADRISHCMHPREVFVACYSPAE
jgi:hypothetical protein